MLNDISYFIYSKTFTIFLSSFFIFLFFPFFFSLKFSALLYYISKIRMYLKLAVTRWQLSLPGHVHQNFQNGCLWLGGKSQDCNRTLFSENIAS